MDEDTVFEPTIFEAARRYPVVTLGFAMVFALLGLVGSRLVFDGWEAQASVLIEDPTVNQVFNTASTRQPERYLASQVAIIESREVAEDVHQLVNDHDQSVRDVLETRQVLTTSDTDLVVISFQHWDPDFAVAFANAYGEAYVDYRDEVTTSSFNAALAGLNDSISAVDEELTAIDRNIEAIASGDEANEFEAQLRDSIVDLLDNPGSAEQIQLLAARLQALEALQSSAAQSQSLALLLDSRANATERRSQLVLRRDQLQVDSALASDGIVAFNRATEAERSLGTAQIMALGLILGTMLGLGWAYVLTRRHRRFEHRSQPEAILGIPLLAEVPVFRSLDPIDRMPVLNDPSSAEAEAFRFASNAIVARLNNLSRQSDDQSKVVAITSALLGAGKTTVTLNAGLSAATRGRSVLIFDADFGDPKLSRMLTGDPTNQKGVTDILDGTDFLSDVVVPVNLGEGHQVDVLTRGTQEISAVDFFRSSQGQDIVRFLRNKYDHILMDAPPLLQVAYASSVISLADVVALVIPHESRVQHHEELMNRLDLLGTEAIGYIYNKAPRRSELFEQKGSMLDPLGTGSRDRE